MRLPVFSTYRELSDAPRRFLFFSMFNVVSWQCTVGAILVLFAREIGMPPAWVGFLISFMPFSMVLVAGTMPLVTLLGPRRLMFGTWLIRNLTVSAVFLMPSATASYGPRAAWYVLIAATLGFCVVRAVGAGGWFPWLHEVLPENQRGMFFTTEAAVVQTVNVAIVLLQGLLLMGNPGLDRFLVVYGVGIGVGLFSTGLMLRIPGGRAIEEVFSLAASFRSYGVALADRRFVRFVVTASLCFSSAGWLTSAFVMYLRDVLCLSERIILTLMATGSFGILLTIRSWGRFADHSGSGRAMSKTMTGHAIAALFFLALVPGAPWTFYLVGPAVVILNVFNAALFVAANRSLLHHVRETARVGYTSIWITMTAITMGATPILAGMVIQTWGLWGFRACFGLSAFTGIGCALACLWAVDDGRKDVETRSWMLNPVLPLRTLGRIVWITAGLHESNRAQRG